MANKKETKQKVEVPVVETPVVETPTLKKVEPKNPTWEIKDSSYYLKRNQLDLLVYIGLMKKKVSKENLSIVKIKKPVSLTKCKVTKD